MKKLLFILLTLITVQSFAQDTIYAKVRVGTPGVYNIALNGAGDSLTWYAAGVRHAVPIGGSVDLSNYYNKSQTDAIANGKQDVLVSGVNIKTINGNPILGSGNISITAGTGSNDADSLAGQPGSYYAPVSSIPTIPTNVSAFTNDANYATTTQLGGYRDTGYHQSITALKPLYFKQVTADSSTLNAYIDSTLKPGSDSSLPTSKAVGDALSLKLNISDTLFKWVHLSGNDTIQGNKFYTGKIGVNNYSPLAPVHIGNANVNNSVDAELLVSRNVDNTGTGNAHGYSDGSQITRSGNMAYASYDGRVNFLGTNSYDHYVSFQAAPIYGSSGTITNLYGLYSLPTVTAGTVTNNYGAFIERANVTGGTIVNSYGLYIDAPIAGTSNNFAIYSNGTAKSYLGGNLSIGKSFNTYGGYGNALDLQGGITIHRPDDALNTYLMAVFDVANNAKTTILLDNSNNVIFTNKTSGKYFAFYTDNTSLALVLSGGKVGVGKVPTVPLDVVGNIATTGNVTSIQYKLSSLNTAPISATDTGTLGEIKVTSGYIYVCIATNTWVRAALTSW